MSWRLRMRLMVLRSIVVSKLLVVFCCGVLAKADELPVQWQDLVDIDRKVYVKFPDAMGALAASHLPVDESGLIGRNRQWGALYSPRFQVGAGNSLRMTIAAGRLRESRLAFRAIEAGTEVIEPNGFVPSALPAHIGGQPSSADIASGAAFFLGDACMGILALSSAENVEQIISKARLASVSRRLIAALRWLFTQQDILKEVDRHAPNRLLFNARAFRACGMLVSGEDTRESSRNAANHFVDLAIAQQADNGHFIEGGGHDTSYQGVAVRIGEDILLSGYPDPESRFRKVLNIAALWLSGRVDTEGRIDSSGNTRTCWSDETVFSKPKLISVSEIFSGLVYNGIQTNDASLLTSARRIENWVSSNPGTDPCFP